MKLFYSVEKNGKKLFEKESKSFLKNFGLLLYGLLTSTPVQVKDINGTTVNIRTNAQYIQGPSNVCVGTSNAPVSSENYTLSNLTELSTSFYNYESSTYGETILVGIRRATTNETWKEIGLVFYLYDTDVIIRKVLMCRDVLPTEISLAPTDVMLVSYRIVVS